MQKTLFSSFLLASVSTSLTAYATNKDEINYLPESLVTATRSETARNELASAATVYTREDIARLQVRTLPDLLKGSPGLDVVQNGGYGQTADVYMRGTNSNHLLVLIDGIKAGSVTLGTTAFQFIPIDQIERVEIVRGPQSSLYGSEAIGGVIQIFTRKGKQSDKPSISLEAGGGSYDTHREAGNVSGRWQNSWYNLGVSNIESNGFAPKVIVKPGVPNEGNYDNAAVNARAGHRFDNNTEIEASFLRSQGANHFTGTNLPDSNNRLFVNQMIGTSLAVDVADNWRSTLRFGQTRDESTSLYPTGLFYSNFNTTRWNASWMNDIRLSDDHKATWGADYRKDEVESSTLYNQASRYDVGVFAQLHSRIFDQHFVNTSIRWDDNQAVGDSVTGNIGWRFNWQHGLSAFASFGNAFNAPTFNQLYFPGYGNSHLKPESSETVEAGVAGQHNWGQWELRAYHTEIDNLISTKRVNNVYIAENVNQAQIEGVEGEISWEFFSWTNKLTGNILSPRDKTSNRRLQRRAGRTLSYDVSKRFGAFDVGGTVLAQGDRYESGGIVAGFVTLDFRTAYHFDKNWMISGKLNNVLDKQYQTISNYNMADRNFFFSIHYNN